MNTSPESRLAQILREQMEVASSLARTLDSEADAIRDRDAKMLVEIAPEKLEGLQRLEKLENSRQQLVSQTEKTTETENPLWDRVLQIIRVCERKNQLNGVMLSLRQEHVERAMDLIANRDASAIVYTPNGSTRTTARPLGTSVSA